MKKLVFLIILATVFSARAQTIDAERETLVKLNETVVSLYRGQKFDEALKAARQALDMSVKVYGGERIQTAIAYTNLGAIYREKRKFDESIENFQKAADIYQKIPNFKGAQKITAFETLAYSQSLDGRKSEAEANYLKAVEIAESSFGKQSKESFSPILSSANFYARDGKFEKADEFYLKAYAVTIKNFGKEGKEIEQIADARACLFGGQKIGDDKEKAFSAAVDNLFGVDAAEKSGIINGKALSLPKPRYPAEAREKRLSGTASVKVTIDEQGNVVQAKSICRNDVLGKAAEESARGAKFSPTIKNGKPVSVTGIIVYNFIP
jgi:TonB family protein